MVQVLIKKELAPEKAETYRRFQQIMDWAEGHRKLRVRTNADLPDQAAEAIAFGAEGIGLCRTEHMFFDHIAEMREMIMAETTAAREAALAKMLPFQRDDFAGLFRAMAGRPVTIRLLDPPLHEFLPQDKAGREEMARVLGKSVEAVARRVEELHESNPMLGHRGCRLGIVYPEITAMQARAIFEAAVQVKKEGVTVHPEVMIPLVGFRKELQNQEKIVRDDGGQGVRRDGREGGVPGRHDDRGAAGLRDGRRDRQDGGVLQLRHQRPDADDAGHEPRRLRAVHLRLHRPEKGGHPARPIRSPRSTRTASGR